MDSKKNKHKKKNKTRTNEDKRSLSRMCTRGGTPPATGILRSSLIGRDSWRRYSFVSFFFFCSFHPSSCSVVRSQADSFSKRAARSRMRLAGLSAADAGVATPWTTGPAAADDDDAVDTHRAARSRTLTSSSMRPDGAGTSAGCLSRTKK